MLIVSLRAYVLRVFPKKTATRSPAFQRGNVLDGSGPALSHAALCLGLADPTDEPGIRGFLVSVAGRANLYLPVGASDR